MKGLWVLLLGATAAGPLRAQDIDAIVQSKEVERIEKILSSDNMQGRATFTPGIEKAADFIIQEFKAAGLQSWDNSGSYRQSFRMIKTKFISASGSLDGELLESRNILFFSSKEDLSIDQNSGYERVFIKPGDNFSTESFKYLQGNKNCLVLVDTAFSKKFNRLLGLRQHQIWSDRSVIFVLTTHNPDHYQLSMNQQITTELPLANIVGILPGKSKKNEYVIFSGHYDHLGIGKPNKLMDSIYNGANDDASGSTAVIMLAKYFSSWNKNERTLVFATFTAEEIGEYGSQYFSRQFDPARVVAMFNIEMIGTESKWGTNSAFITGFEKSDMGKVLEQNLQGSRFRFYPDPYLDQDLFYRSDNASLARLGVPAHTISTSKMDAEKYYHTPGDEIGTLDMKNMAEIIKAIAISSGSIVSGKDSPSRVDSKELK